ncbi:MAG TPA: hypothetical protein VHC21_04010 [Candidatus Saccharimonadales bacterium]|nr:hypothetical protein [Candidatus Saccharimonadales bacterium]
MTTTDQVLLIVVAALLSVFLLLCIGVMAGVLKLIKALREVVAKAEEVADSVESAAEVLRDTSGPLAMFKLIRNIMKATQKGRRK